MIITLDEAFGILLVLWLTICLGFFLGNYIALKLKRENDKRKSSK